MKISQVIKELAEMLYIHGDLDVEICLLTEHGDVEFDKFTVDAWVNLAVKNDSISFTLDFEDVDEFKERTKPLLG